MGQQVTSFGKYPVERFVEQSSIGVTYIARDPESGERLLLRVPTPPEDVHEARTIGQALLDRAAAARGLHHPSLIGIRDFGTYGGSHLPFIAYELLDGKSLAETSRGGNRFTTGDIVDLGIAIAGALVHVHERQLLHGSISPATILVAPRGVYKLADIALIQPDRSPFDRQGQFRGEASYMAPEQVAAGALDGRADLFSLGVVLYELLVGELPYTWRSKDIPGEIAHSEAPIPSKHRPGIPPALNAIVYRLIQKDVTRRPTRADEVLEALEAAKLKLAHPAAVPAGPRIGTPRWVLPVAVAAVIVALAVPVGWHLLAPASRSEAPPPVAAPLPSETDRVVQLRRQAEEALSAGDLAKARRLLNELWAAGSGDHTDIELAERLRAASQAKGQALVEQGNGALGRKRWEEASAAFAQALAVLPDDPAALRGAELARKGWLEGESRQAQDRAQAPVQAAAVPTPLPAPLRLLFNSPLPQGSIEVSIDGRPLSPVRFDFSGGEYMGMQRKGGGRVMEDWDLSRGKHKVALRLLDATGKPLQEASYDLDVAPGKSFLIRLEMKDARSTPRFYLSQQTVR